MKGKIVSGKFEIFKDSKKEYRFRLIAKNGKIICQSEGYKTKGGVNGGIKAVKELAIDSEIIVIK